jgi:hypothetical protein
MALVERAIPVGGASLNFEVVGGTTEPTNPKENTIWVNTETAIGEWQFSPLEPTVRADGSSLAAGDVWVKTGDYSGVGFNAIKKNIIDIMPLYCNQYVNGSWAAVIAKTYQEGAWQDWTHYLYNMGETFDVVTGGWELRNTDGKVGENTENGLYAKATSSEGSYSFNWHTINLIDVTPYKTLKAIARSNKSKNSNANGDGIHRLGTTLREPTWTPDIALASVNSIANTAQEISVDISGQTGLQRIIYTYQGGRSAEVYVQKIWFE